MRAIVKRLLSPILLSFLFFSSCVLAGQVAPYINNIVEGGGTYTVNWTPSGGYPRLEERYNGGAWQTPPGQSFISPPGQQQKYQAVNKAEGRYEYRAVGISPSGPSAGVEYSSIVDVDVRIYDSSPNEMSSAEADDISDHNPLVGATAGEHTAGQDGSVSYTIPIIMPKGIAGISPNLSFTYNNNGGNGAMGVGWSLSGISSIKRCPNDHRLRSERYDPVDFDDSDKYCLDGIRMVVISGGYGDDGAEYRLENEDFTKIVSYGRSGNGPLYFRVWTKSGMIKEFGRTASSREKRKVY